MTTELATSNPNGIEILPPARPLASEAIGQLMAHAEAMNAAHQLAAAMCASELVPAIYRGKPDNGAAAILYGAELGLTPIQSLQQIFVVHGQPAIYARTAVAMVKRAGVIVETISSTDDAVTVRATDRRTGQVEESTWTVERAKKAGYTSNKKYDTDPQGMLYAKAAMECCRKIAPDVLLGIAYASEELELEPSSRVRSERAEPARGVAALTQRVSGPQPTEPAPATTSSADPNAMSPESRKKWLGAMFAGLTEADCNDRNDQLTVITELAQRRQDPPEHRDAITDAELRQVVNAINAARKDGSLGQVVTDILNQHAINQAEAANQ